MDKELKEIKELENEIRFLSNKVHVLERKHKEMLDEYLSKKSRSNKIASFAKYIGRLLRENNLGSLVLKLDVYEKYDEYGPKTLTLSCSGIGFLFKITFHKDYKTGRYYIIRNNMMNYRPSTKHFRTKDDMFRYLEKFLRNVPQIIESNILRHQELQLSRIRKKLDEVKKQMKGVE